jgi:hypothetical protein
MDPRTLPIAGLVVVGLAIVVRVAVGLVRLARRNRVAAAEGLLVESVRDALGRWCDGVNESPAWFHDHAAHGPCDGGSHAQHGHADVPDCGALGAGDAHE